MADNKIQRKCTHDKGNEGDDEPNTKQPRRAKRQPGPSISSIFDLNDMCLEHVFNYLDVIDLVNLSHAMDQRSRNIAGYVYKRKFGNHSIEFDDNTICLSDTYPERPIAATITDMRGLLEHFGRYIGSITISYNKALHDGLMPMLVEQCAKTLNTFIISGWANTTEVLFEAIKVPFEKVNHLTLLDIRQNLHSLQLYKWFPNVRSLRLGDIISADADYLAHHFVHLTNFRINGHNATDIPGLIKMFEVNPQLTVLNIGYIQTQTGEHIQVDRRLLDGIGSNLPNLEILKMKPLDVTIPRGRHARTAGLFGAILPNAIVDDSRKPIPYTFDRLRSLNLFNCIVWNSEWTKFVVRHTNLEELFIHSRFSDLPVNIEQIVGRLPNLLKLRAIGCTVSINNIKWILTEHKSISRLRVKRVYDETINAMLSHEVFMNYADNWTIIEDRYFLLFKRKVL